jgi:hypothetical protein
MGWAASVDFCPLLRHREMGRQVKKKQILMTWRVWGGGKKLLLWCIFVSSGLFALSLLLLLLPYSTSLLITPWNLVAYYAVNLSLHRGMCRYVLHCRLLLMASRCILVRTIHYVAQTQMICLSFLFFLFSFSFF